MNNFVALMHRYCFDYTNRQDLSVCDEIMTPGYTLHMGSYTLVGRDEHYKPAARKQFRQFPGLCLTVNGLITNGDRLLLHFSEHGASGKHAGARAAWSGIGLYQWDGERLTENFVEQDYYARQRQLAGAGPAPVETPAVAPWDTEAEASDPAAEALVRGVLEAGGLGALSAVVRDDAWTGASCAPVLEASRARVDDLFSAGDKVAFRVTEYGTPSAEFAGAHGGQPDQPAELHATGFVTVRDGVIVGGRVITDRLGLSRRLATAPIH